MVFNLLDNLPNVSGSLDPTGCKVSKQSRFLCNFHDFFESLSLTLFFSDCLFSAKPIDLLAQYVSSDDNDLEIQMHEPYTILVVSECLQ